MSIRILLADDHQMFAEGLADILRKEPGLEVVERVRDGGKAVEAALRLEPDVVVMDLSMPVLNGIEATRKITAEGRQIKVLCLTIHRELQFLSAALEAGATGYVLKDQTTENLAVGIRRVSGGSLYLFPEMAAAAAYRYRTSVVTGKARRATGLTTREREVLRLVADGYTSHEIAKELCVSERTVATHRRHLAEKLHIRGVAGLTKYSIRHGLTTAERDRRDSPPARP